MGYVDCRVTKYIPARFKHILYRRQKVACRTCEGQIAVAPLPQERVLDNSTPCPYLLAKIVTNKAVDIIPLNRTQKRFKSDGFDVSVQNLCRWEEGARQMLQPLVDRIAQKVKEADLIMLDDTNLKVRRKDAQNGIIKGRLWTFIGRYFDPGGDLKKTQEYTYYMYAPNWSTEHPEQYLYGSSAMLQGDGYKGYERIACEYMDDCVGKILSGCMMYGRGRFYEAYEYGDPLASFFIQRFQKIYRIEAVAKEKDLTVEQRRQLRQENSLLIFQEILSKAQDMQHLSSSRVMRDAIRYLLNQSSKLIVPFYDGRIPLDNGQSERKLRRLAQGRHSCFFAGSTEGARKQASLLSIVGTAESAGMNPRTYIADILPRINDWPNHAIDELLPLHWNNFQHQIARSALAHSWF